MQAYEELNQLIQKLWGPEGCPWDQKQTVLSLSRYLIEEVNELVEAIRNQDKAAIQEELGDLFFNVVFMMQLAEKEKIGTVNQVIEAIKNKLIRRHPHVFGAQKASTVEEAIAIWQEEKRKEKSSFSS